MGHFSRALPIWLELQLEQPDNFNLNYKVGVCYIHSTNNKSKALSFLVKAVQNTSKNYDPFSTSEKKSPIKAYFYLARAYHINYELDAALLNYNSFKEKVSKKHYLFKEADHHMEQCRNAKEEMKNPKNVEIKNSIVGPHVSIGENTVVKNSIISNSIIQTNTIIRSTNFKDSMVGNHTKIKGKVKEYSIGDYNEID